MTLCTQCIVDTRSAVLPTTFFEDNLDSTEQPHVRQLTLVATTALPLVVRACRYVQHAAQIGNRERGLLRSDEPINSYRFSFAKKAAAFFRMA